MPSLGDIDYSRDACILAVRDYYQFLTKMYADETMIIEPPEGGWPDINTTALQGLGKTHEVISLLRHLPYIRKTPEPAKHTGQTSAVTVRGRSTVEAIRIMTEDNQWNDVPPHVIGLTSGGRNNPIFLLDTELGVIYWMECPGEIRDNPAVEPISDDAYDYADENEADWRADGLAWEINDFFEVLKNQYRQLRFIPVSPCRVIDIYTVRHPRDDGMIPLVQDVYRAHGWPDLTQYRKQECFAAIHTTLQEQFPHFAEALHFL